MVKLSCVGAELTTPSRGFHQKPNLKWNFCFVWKRHGGGEREVGVEEGGGMIRSWGRKENPHYCYFRTLLDHHMNFPNIFKILQLSRHFRPFPNWIELHRRHECSNSLFCLNYYITKGLMEWAIATRYSCFMVYAWNCMEFRDRENRDPFRQAIDRNIEKYDLDSMHFPTHLRPWFRRLASRVGLSLNFKFYFIISWSDKSLRWI